MKLMKRTILLGASGAFFSVIVPSFGAVIHNESINGDLSGILTSPTVLALTPSTNTLIAQMGNNGNSGATNGSAFINASSGNILDDFTGSAAPLGQGVYSFWFQETSANTVNYQVTLNVIPEPSTTLLGLTGLGLLLASRRRKS
jgi:hypothetical protein